MTFAIRPLAAVDFDGWRRLWIGYRRFYSVETDAPLIESTWAQLLAGDGLHGAVAVDREDRPIALAHFLKRRSTWTTGYHCYLEDLFVDEQERGHGVASDLIEYACAWASGQGCTSIGWLTHEGNARARRLYDRVAEYRGFIHYQKRL